ncbi:uncharacterized protein LOC117305114 [Asterias rubens]|uniref:uncharacterized protein LOC117305114 n=1 Tax=Asterias rubens TaxID=7604 RepID=UPI00145588BC|nr:uncharacterized protein LOC117305114 [Asterias rubens]
MMHLQFPKSRNFYTWEELSCLSRALGFPSETIRNCIPDEVTNAEDGISIKAILRLIELKYFNDALDRSINMHTADYNINTLMQSLKLLNHRLLSFSELNDVRVAFQVYEAGDMRGMKIDTHTQLRALKLCDRTIAPMKLMHRVKHMQENFDEPGRIQLYEFLDLIVLCELTSDVELPDHKHGALDKTWRRLFELDNFEEVCITKDEKVEQHLNQHFKNTELNYGQEKMASKRIPRESAVNTSRRQDQVRHHNKKYRELQGFMGQSTAQVQRTKAGHIRGRPVTAPEMDDFRLPVDSPLHSILQRPHTVSDLTSRLTATPQAHCRPQSAPHSAQGQLSSRSHTSKYFSQPESTMPEDPRIRLLQALHERKTLFSSPPLLSPPRSAPGEQGVASQRPWRKMVNTYIRPQTPNVITEKDVTDRQHVLDGLQYQIETLEERALQKLEQQMKLHLPRYDRQKREMAIERKNRTPTPTQPKKKSKKKKSKGLPPASIERLAHPVVRQFHDLHDKNCDARTQEYDVPKSSRRPKEPKSEEKGSDKIPHLKPQLMLDGRRMSASSTMSSIADSSIAKTIDLASHSLLLNSAMSQKTPVVSVPHVYDPERFSDSRVGSAALLHDFFNDVKTDNGSDGTSTKHSENPADVVGQNSRVSETALSQPKVSSSLEGSKRSPVRPTKKKMASDPRLSRWEKARVNRKISTLEEEELKINGISLSEIDRLTFKEEEEQLKDFRDLKKISQDFYFH